MDTSFLCLDGPGARAGRKARHSTIDRRASVASDPAAPTGWAGLVVSAVDELTPVIGDFLSESRSVVAYQLSCIALRYTSQDALI
jgi:hypothetical protein